VAFATSERGGLWEAEKFTLKKQRKGQDAWEKKEDHLPRTNRKKDNLQEVV
jgi:hypothetical protein